MSEPPKGAPGSLGSGSPPAPKPEDTKPAPPASPPAEELAKALKPEKDKEAEGVLKELEAELQAKAGNIDLHAYTLPQRVTMLRAILAKSEELRVKAAPAADPAKTPPPQPRVKPKTMLEENNEREWAKKPENQRFRAANVIHYADKK